MAQPRRDGTYIWVTWLTKLLAGEAECEWAAWFQARHDSTSWTKAPSNFDSTAWNLAHTALLRTLRTRFEADGYAVRTENQNSFRLTGASGISLGGKPDLIAINGATALVIDAKTGSPKASDNVQVLIYMWALPTVFREFRDKSLTGVVAYPDHEVTISASAVTDEFTTSLLRLIGRVGSQPKPQRVPSGNECRFCKITSADCADRVEAATAHAVVADF